MNVNENRPSCQIFFGLLFLGSSVSNDNLTFTYDVTYLNRAPIITQSLLSLSSILEDDNNNSGEMVGQLAMSVGSDRDDMPLGLAVTLTDQSNGVWQYRSNEMADWVQFPLTIDSGFAVELNATNWIRFIPSEHYFGPALFIAHLWDMSSPYSGLVDIGSAERFSGPFSAQNSTFVLNVVHINDPSVVSLDITQLTFIESEGPIQLFLNLTITDVDSTSLVQATVLIDCLNSTTMERESCLTSGDMVTSQGGQLVFQIVETVPSSAAEREFRINPLGLDMSVTSFESFLRTLYFNNEDLETSTQPRLVQVFVSDGINSSNTASVTVDIELVNDEQPSLSLPFSSFMYQENSGLVQLFSGGTDARITDADSFYPLESVTIELLSPFAVTEILSVNCSRWFTCDYLNNTLSISGPNSVSEYNQVLSSLTYENFEDEPEPQSSRSIIFTVSDGIFTSSPEIITIVTTLINDKLPEIAPATTSVNFTEGTESSPSSVAIGLGLRVMDRDSGDFLIYSIQAVLEDPVDVGNERIEVLMTFPGYVAVYRNDTTIVISVVDNSVDRNGNLITGLPLFVVQDFLNALRYSNDAVQPSGDRRTVQIMVRDSFTLEGIMQSDPALITIDFIFVDDLPVVQLNRVEFSYFEGDSEVPVAPEAVVIDVDNVYITGLLIQLTSSVNISQDVIRINESSLGGTIILTSYTIRENEQTLVLSNRATTAMYTEVLRTLTYEHLVKAGNPPAGDRMVQVTPLDVNGAMGVADVLTIAFLSTNNHPIIDLNGQLPMRFNLVSFREEGPPIYVVSRDFSLTDVDSPELQSVLVRLENHSSGDLIFLNNTSLGPSNITVVDTSSSILLLGAPSPIEEFRSLLLTLQYVNVDDEPSFLQEQRNVTITIEVSDGMLSASATTTVLIIPSNDPPQLFFDFNSSEPRYTYVEGSSPVSIATNPRIVDPDSLLFNYRVRPMVINEGDVLQVPDSQGNMLPFDSTLGYYYSPSLLTRLEVLAHLQLVTISSNIPEPAPGNRLVCFSVVDDLNISSFEVCSDITFVFINDSPPMFDQSVYNSQIEENRPHAFVAQVSATDADSRNSEVTLVYTIVGGDDCMAVQDASESGSGSGGSDLMPQTAIPLQRSCRFTINSTSGVISTTGTPPDYEERTSYVLTVQVSDGMAESSATVNIEILNVNDLAPRFEQLFYTVTIPLGATAGFLVAEIVASDIDQENFTIYLMNMEPLEESVFLTFPNGSVYLNIPENMLRTDIARYTLFFNVTDGEFFSSSLAILEVNIILNNAAPQFDQTFYSANLSELIPVGTTVIRTMATDADTGSNAEITYSISQENLVPDFIINSATGAILLASGLDFETTQIYSFTIMATDNGRPRRSGTATVFIRIINENEQAPMFAERQLFVYICEDATVGTEIARLAASDIDAGSLGEVTYVLVNGDSTIALNDTSGALTIAEPLDFEGNNRYFVVSVVAQDAGGLTSMEAQVEVELLNNNEFPPMFLQSVYHTTIPENYPVSNPLPFLNSSQILASDRDGCNIDQCVDGSIITQEPCSGLSGVTYRIASGNSEGLFAINSDTGIVFLTSNLDFDESAHRSFALELVASDGEFNATASLLVTVTDFNEHLPIFENSSYIVTILESIEVGTSVLTVPATDQDPTSVIQYTLAGLGSEDFDIGATSGVVMSARPLNFVSRPVYNLVVTAMNPPDGTNGSLPVTAALTIYLIDVNNNSPNFIEDSYTFILPENAPSTSIGRVIAIDLDAELNAIVIYSILSVSPGNLSLFSINTSSGEIFSTVPLDREQEDMYLLTVQARDSGIPSLSSTVNVTILILNENDNPPQLFQRMFVELVAEDAPVNTVLVTIRASDPDDPNTAFSYRIESGNTGGRFQIHENGTVFIAQALDREQIGFYNLMIAVSDLGSPPRSSIAIVEVTVSDVNDNPPMFSRPTYSTSVSENIPPAYSFIRIEAFDADQGTNAAVTFSIANSTVPFQIDSTSGAVSVSSAEEIDREKVSYYDLIIIASNPDGKSSTAQLTVSILDENDNAPAFTSDTLSVSIDEDFTPVGSTIPAITDSGGSGMGITRRLITTVIATDVDQPNTPNSQVVYSLVSVSPSANFEIDQNTGELYVTQLLDRENIPAYVIEVEAADSNETNPQRSRVNVTITVGDINDNAPFFVNETFRAAVLENVPNQTEVLRLQAVDYDIGVNAILEFSLETSDNFPFSVVPQTGIIRTTSSLDREGNSSYSFFATVQNPGMTSTRAKASVDITILDVNDNPPQLIPSSVNLIINENVPIGTVLTTFTVTDADIGANADTVLSLTGYSSLFNLSNNELVVSNVLDHEIPEHRSIMFDVIARNTEQPREMAVANVLIELNNLNDNPPIVNFGEGSLEYLERNKRLVLNVGAFIIDDDGADETTLVDGIVELVLSDVREPSQAFVPNTNDPFIPYKCPLEDDKVRKFEPCNLTIRDDHVFTSVSRDLMTRGFNVGDIKDNTIVFDSTKEQYAYSSIATNFLQTGLTISTWIWFDPREGSTVPFTIVSKASPTSVLYSVYCSADGRNLEFQYQSADTAAPVVFSGACTHLQGAWNHLAVVLDNSNPVQWRVSAFINANLYSQQSISTPIDVDGSVFLGTRPDGGVNAPRKDFFNGRLHLLVFSYNIANGNELNCVIGCGVAIISTLENTPLEYTYNYSTRALNVRGRYGIQVYEEFLNSLVLILPLIEPVSPSYTLNYTVQDDMFNCLPNTIIVILHPVNDHQPQLNLNGHLSGTNDSNFTASFIEEQGPVSIVNATALSLTDADLVAFTYTIIVKILNPKPQGSSEILAVSNVPPDMNVTYENNTLTMSGSYQLPIFQAVLRTTTYNNLDDEPSGDHRLIQYTVIDTPQEDEYAYSLVNIVLVNDAPEVNLTFSLSEYSEGDGPVRFIESATITDSDNTILASGLVRFNIRDINSEILSVNTANTNLRSSYNGLTGELMITGEDTLSNYSTVLESLTYNHINMNDPTPGTRVFYITVFDGTLSNNNSSAIAMVFFSAINDQPVVDLNGQEQGIDSEVTFTENRDSSVLVCPQAVLVDVDNATLVSLSLTLSPQPDGPQEQITIELPSDLEANRTQILSGESFPLSVQQYQTILRSLRYINLAEEPTPEQRVVEVIASDGLATSIPAFARITVQSVNDVPVLDIDTLSTQPGYQTVYLENGPAVYITGRNVTIIDNDINAGISAVMVVIQGATDGLDERIISTDPSYSIAPMLSNGSIVTNLISFSIAAEDLISFSISLQAAEEFLTTLQYRNLRAEPTPGAREISISVSDEESFSIPEIATLELVTVNEHSPRFLQSSYSRSVMENLSPEVLVVTVQAVDDDSGIEGQLSYQIESSDPQEGLSRFRIDNSGNIFTTVALDRENIDFYVLNISASDGGNPPRSDTARVEISVLDRNDQSPVFTAGTQFDLSIAEGLSGMVLVSVAEAMDSDFGENAIVTYSLGGTSPIFSVQENGSIYAIAELLDADVPNPSYVITVVATDRGMPPLQTSANFTITVIDINDNPPQFNMREYFGKISENAAPGTSIVTVFASDLDSGDNGRITYSIYVDTAVDGPVMLPFSINADTGLITNSRELDRESEQEQIFIFLVQAKDNGNPPQSIQLAQVNITVLDENDNSPVFEVPMYTGSLPENSPNQTFVLRVSAMDADSGTNGNITYHIVPNPDILPFFSSDPLFLINQVTGDIVVNGNIDFEMRSGIAFVIEAQDMGNPRRTGTANVVLSIVDVNDNPPQFNMSVYTVSVEESVPAGFTAITVAAFDADSNQNGEVSYTLVDNTNVFTINSMTGEISTATTLDFERDCYYRLLVIASDNGLSERLNATAIVDIFVAPVHDVPPVFSRSSYSITVMENIPRGSSIVQVSATDGDITDCPEVNLSPSSGSGALDLNGTPDSTSNFIFTLLNHNNLFSINNYTGLIQTVMELDYEESPQYVLRVRAEDPGGLASEVSVTVTLLDLNDNVPMFDQPFYSRVVPENTPVATPILQLTATDGDSIDQGRLMFSLGDVPQGVFVEINNQTGAIFTTGVIDFDTLGSMVQFFAAVTDTADRVSSTVIRLTITDVIDIPPVINTAPRTLSFTEGTFSLIPVPEMSVTDADTSQILCSATITLDIPQVLNTATQCSCPDSQVSSCTLGCFEFLQVAPGSFPGSVVQSENGTVLMLIGNYSIQTYEIAIRSIQYINLISNPVPESRTIAVYVFDCQLPSNVLVNTINVQALNVFPPVVDLNGPLEAGINYNVIFMERGSSVNVAAQDAFISDNDTIREREELTGLDISITNPQTGDYLTFPASVVPVGVNYQNNSHTVSFTGVAPLSEYTTLLLQIMYVNREDEPEPSDRNIAVVAHEYHLLSFPATTTVSIMTINDYPPVILTQPPLTNRETSYFEETAGVAVVSANAVISDLDSSSDPVTGFQVSLTSPTPYDLLFLNISSLPTSINLLPSSTNASLAFNGNAPVSDYERVMRAVQYRFTGEEIDFIFPMRFVQLRIADTMQSSFSVVQIRLIPINDQMPEFDAGSYTTEVPENVTVGSSILKLIATDGDRFSTNNIQYSIIAGNEGSFFNISQETGVIVLQRMLDYETGRTHRFIAEVRDTNFEGAGTSVPSTANVTINVRDINDRVPMFDSPEYNATIGESVPINTFVLQVFASDEDSAAHSALEFSLVNTTDFAINQDGVIFTNADIDRERVDVYYFIVRVRNPGLAAFDMARVTVTVLDLDDNPPVITLDPNTIVLMEPTTSVQLSVNLDITDLDPNPSLDYAIVQVSGLPVIGQLFSTAESSMLSVSGNGTTMLVITGESRPLSDYISVLRGVVYQDLAEEPANTDRIIAYQVGSTIVPNQPIQLEDTPGETTSNIVLFTVSVRLINDQQPMLSLDQGSQTDLPSPCLGSPGSYFTMYMENQANPVPLSNSSLVISDGDSGESLIHFAEVQILNPADRGLERLGVTLQENSSISVLEGSDDFKIILSGPAQLQDYEVALRSVV